MMARHDEPASAEDRPVHGQVAVAIVVFTIVLILLDALEVQWPLTGAAALVVALSGTALFRVVARRTRRRRSDDAGHADPKA